MTTEEKQKRLIKFVHNIRPNISVKFEMSNRWKNTYGLANLCFRRIRFTKALFQFTLESCFNCAIHEIAHIVDGEKDGHSYHNKRFAKVRDKLMKKYGSPTIEAANREKRSLLYSDYIEDLS